MKKIRQGIGIVCLLINPALMYIIFEWITESLNQVQGIYIVLNLAIFYAVYLVIFALSNSMRISYVILNGIFTFWAMAEYFVVGFRERPIMLWDIMAFRTAMAVSANYQYIFTKKLIAIACFMLVWSGFLCFFPVRLPSWKQNWKARLVAVSTSIMASVVFFVMLFQVGFLKYGIEINMWEPVGSYAQYGYMLSTLKIVDYYRVEAPAGYSLQAIQDIQAQIEKIKETEELKTEIELKTEPKIEAETELETELKTESKIETETKLETELKSGNESSWKTDSKITPTNIICIMNESYSDLQIIEPFETDIPYNTFYNSMQENVIKGNLYMPVFGAMTSNSEYEVLTGNSLAFAPEGSVPYQIYMKEPTPSLAYILKSQGYRTVAMHPNIAGNWNRTEAYQAMGFDEYYDISFYEDAPLVRNYVGDKGDYDKIIQLTEEKKEGEPLFIFNVTMQNHGGYADIYESTVHLKGELEAMDFPLTEQYLSLMKESDEALQYIIEYYSQVEEPTMIIMFGDHQPGIETEFYETLKGKALDQFTLEEMLKRYITPFFIWTNYSTESSFSENMSAQYLSCAILERANLEMSAYQKYLAKMYETVPVIHMLGYYTSEMQFENWDNWREKEVYSVLHPFELLQYHNMFEKRRISSLFFLDTPTS